MSRWLYQVREENYRGVRERQTHRWPTGKKGIGRDSPEAGDIIVFFYVPAGGEPGICGLGIITKYLPKSSKFDWLALPPTKILKSAPWWDERVEEYIDLIRRESPWGTMYQMPAVVEESLRRGLFAWAAHPTGARSG